MLEFIVIVCVLILISLLFFAPTLFKTNHLPAENYDQRNTLIARERLEELKQNLESGDLSQEEFDQVRQELEKNLAIDLSAQQSESSVENSSKPSALVLIALVPVAAAIIYMQLGDPDAIDAKPQMQTQNQNQHSGNDAPQMSMDEALSKLSSRLKEKPNDPQGWFMLARTYMSMNRFDEAVSAYEKTIELVDEDADLLVRYADALAMSNEGVLKGKPREVLEKALILNPQHQQGLWLAGVAAIEEKEFKSALTRFLILQPMLMSNQEALSQLHNMIAHTEKNMTEDEIKLVQASMPASVAPKSVGISADAGSAQAVSKAEIQVTVSVDDSLKNQLSAQDTVFIYAKAMNGPPMPLAAVRKTVGDLPITVTLNDAMAMMPSMKLSAFDEVKVGAKISKSGEAGASAGDLFGEIQGVGTKSAENVSVLINQTR